MRPPNVIVALGLTLGGAAAKELSDNVLEEYCFTIAPQTKILMQRQTTTPLAFVSDHPTVLAAINGPYFDSEGKLEGLAYLADGQHLATRGPQDIRGYFSINKAGTKTHVSEQEITDFGLYWLVIGTHPLLMAEGSVHSQALENRYDKGHAFRSAIGTKDEKNICFAVSTKELSMADWARQLENAEYYGALNLDGGPISQLAVRKDSNVVVNGGGRKNTQLVIYVEKK